MFCHKDFEDFCSANIRQAFNSGGYKYSDKIIKILQVMVWRASDMKRLNHPILIDTNITRDDVDEWYFEAVVEVEKIKKEVDIESPGNFFTLSGVSQTKQSRISLCKVQP